MQDDPIALEAAATVASAQGTVTRNDERYAEVAFPLYTSSGTVILFSSSLRDTLANVELVQRRVLLAAVPALLVAALLGYGLASVFARRIRRLARAADRIAGGREGRAPACHDLTIPMRDWPRPSVQIEEPNRMKIVALHTERVLPVDLVRQRVPREPAHRHA